MSRVKGGVVTARRRKRILRKAKGYFGSKHLLFRTAQEQLLHSLDYAYNDRRKRKGDFRKLWIKRINAACHMNEISYSNFVHGLHLAGITINRKMLSEMAINDYANFQTLVADAKKQLIK
jgi:large subunit ribosomal protein L20